MATDRAPRGSDRRRGGASPNGGTDKTGAFSISLFLMAVLMFMPPILTLAEGPADLFGLPRIYVFLFVVWIAVVAMTFLIAERVRRPDDPDR